MQGRGLVFGCLALDDGNIRVCDGLGNQAPVWYKTGTFVMRIWWIAHRAYFTNLARGLIVTPHSSEISHLLWQNDKPAI